MKSIVFGILLSALNSRIIFANPEDHVEEVFKWKRVVYENLPQPEDSYVGRYPYYIPENVDVTTAGGYHPASGLFIVLMERFRPGIPTSLGAFCVHEYKYLGASPKIWGFPNYKVNALLPEDFEGGSDEEKQERNADNWEQGRKVYKNSSQNYYSYHAGYPFIQRPIYGNPTTSKPSFVALMDKIRIISVFFPVIDEQCNRVFFMDNGQLVYYGNTTYTIQKPAIVVVGLPKDGCRTRNFPIIRRSEIPNRIAAKGYNGFMAATIDYQTDDSCDDLFLYIPNAFYSYLVVYDYRKDDFWAFEHESFLPVVAESHFVFKKTFEYEMQIGIFSITLGYPDENGDRIAYYTKIAGTAQYSVSTKVLKNPRNSPKNYNRDDFKIMGYRGPKHQALRTVIDYMHGVMFYGEVQSNQIRCWNIRKPLNPDNIGVVFESEELLFGINAVIDSLGYLWFHTSHIPIDFITAIPLNLQEINSRVFRVKVEDAIKGTICEN